MIGGVIGFCLLMVVVPVAVNEVSDLAPWLAKLLVRCGAKLLGDPTATERYTEEWLANLEQVPGKVTKLAWSLGLLARGLPRLRWQIRLRILRERRAASAGETGGDTLDRLADQTGLLEQLRLSHGGRPIRVREANDPIVLGVRPATEMSDGAGGGDRVPPFIVRDATPEIQHWLRPETGFVLVVGESAAGKTRAAYEAMRCVLPGYKLVVPENRQALRSLVEGIRRNRRVVLWLDELDQYLGWDGLRAGMVQRMLEDPSRRVVILATMSTQAHARFASRRATSADDPATEVLRSGWEVVRLAHPVRMRRHWSREEITRAQHLGADRRIAAAIRHAHAGDRGVGEYLAAAPQLLDDWLDAWDPGTHPRGAALVAAAVDARRAGFHRPLPVELLRGLHQKYLDDRGGEKLHPEPWPEALAWATRALHATSSLLLPRADEHYLAFDYLRGSLDAQKPPPRIPDYLWDALIDHASPAEALDIGLGAHERGDFKHALVAFDKAVFNGDMLSRRWYAACVRDAGDPRRAVEMFTSLVAESTHEFGPDAEETLANRHGHARSVGESGRPGEAARLFEQLIADRTRVYGFDHPYTLSSRNSHAFFVGDSGDRQRAIRLYEGVLAARTRILGPDHPYTLSSRYGHAHNLGESGRPGEAAHLFEQLVADRTRLRGPNHPYTLNNRRYLAHFLGEAGHAAQAAAQFTQLLADCLAALDPDHPDTLAARYGQARFLGDAGDPHHACKLLDELLRENRLRHIIGPDHPITLIWRRYHAHFLAESGAAKKAAALLDELVADCRRIHGPDHPALFAARITHATAVGQAGSPRDAVLLHQDLVTECTTLLGEDDPHTLTGRHGHARFLGESGNPAEAADLLEILVNDRIRVLGADHPGTFSSRNYHASNVGRAGDPARAVRLLTNLLTDRIRTFGPNHPWTGRTRDELASFQ